MEDALKAIAIATLCLALASTTSNARGPYDFINVGTHGGAYTNDQNGSFFRCAPLQSPSALPKPGKTMENKPALVS
jgi:hypothetical protein